MVSDSFEIPRSHNRALAQFREEMPMRQSAMLMAMAEKEEWIIDEDLSDRALENLRALIMRLQEVGEDAVSKSDYDRLKSCVLTVTGFAHPVVAHWIVEGLKEAAGIDYHRLVEEFFRSPSGGDSYISTIRKAKKAMDSRITYMRSMDTLDGVFGVENRKFVKNGYVA